MIHLAGMSVPTTDTIQRAANSLHEGSAVPLGNYTAIENGNGYLRSTIPRQWHQYAGVTSGDGLEAWLDPETGALIIVPEADP